MSRLTRLTLILLAGFALVASACGSSSSDNASGSVTIRNATVDKPANPEMAAVRMEVDNGTASDDTVISVSTPIGDASVHRSEVVNGLSTMTPVESLPVPASGKVTFAPGGLHVMIEHIEEPLAVGDTFPLTVEFAKAGKVTTDVKVVAMGAGDDTEHEHHG